MLLVRSGHCRGGMCLYTGYNHPRCTDFCETVADCPPSDSCPGGFVCVARFAVGQPACCRMCICQEALHPLERKDVGSCQTRSCGLFR